jgi:hypothetical protein
MRVVRWISIPLLLLLAASGCYTVLRHPSVEEDEFETTSHAYDDPGRVQNCSACHSTWDFGRRPYLPPNDYYQEPWWRRVAARPHVESGGMLNDRPRPPVPEMLPPASLAPPPVTTVQPPAQAPAAPGRATQPAPAPRTGSDRPRPQEPTPRRGEPQDAPEPEAADKPPTQAPQSGALPNDRRSPKP